MKRKDYAGMSLVFTANIHHKDISSDKNDPVCLLLHITSDNIQSLI